MRRSTRRSATLGAVPASNPLGMSQPEFSVAFTNSPMKRAKLRGLERNATVVLGNVGTADDLDVRAHAGRRA